MSSVNTAPPYEIIPIDPVVGLPAAWEELRQQCYGLRVDVFHHEQGFPIDTEFDDQEDVSVHFLLRLTDPAESQKPVGTIRLVRKDGYYKLTRLVVLKDYRQYRYGKALVLALHRYVREEAKKNGRTVARVVAHSQLPVKGFYAKLGYQPEGDEFDEDGAPHQKMVANLPVSE
ncbi:acyl-CoA N-acyltransferase [Panus rudis PR-1116 ss-1]|nr:acyl-CoA N-acyltransferase [Panus rudis PR-1116 ss-1]